MHNNKLIYAIKIFDKYERNRLRKFLQSPYHNPNEQLVQLFQFLCEDIDKSTFREKTKLWKAINGKAAYDDARFRKYNSDLLKLVEEFLTYEKFNQSKEKHIFHLESIEERKLDKLYNSSLKLFDKSIKENNYLNGDHFYLNLRYNELFYRLEDFETKKRGERHNLDVILKELDYFYLIEKLKYYNTILNWEKFAPFKYEILFIDEVLGFVEKNINILPASIQIYYKVALTNLNPEEESHFYDLKSLLFENWDIFPMNEAREFLFQSCINYCARKLNTGSQTIIGELFDIYKFMISNKIIFENNNISPFNFKNIVTTALRLNENEWTKAFISDFQKYLPVDQRKNAVTFNLARYYWRMKEHDRVIELLREVEYEDITYNLSSKSILLATYYETDETEPLYSLLESWNTYLNRHAEIPEQIKKLYKNLIRYTKKLLKIFPGDKEAIEKLHQEIKENKIADAEWLLDKLNELR